MERGYIIIDINININKYKKLLINPNYDINELDILKNRLFTNIINYIKETYDMNIINILDTISPSNLKTELIDFINKENTFNSNKILTRLYKNYLEYFSNSSEIKNIKINLIGPFYYNFFKSRYQKGLEITNIHIFGEYHSEYSDKYDTGSIPSIKFNDYLNLILQNSACFYDIYIETFFNLDEYTQGELSTIVREPTGKSQSKISLLKNQYKKCIKQEKLPECELFRYHHIDVRIKPKDVKDFTIFDYSFKVIEDMSNPIRNPITSEDFSILIKYKNNIKEFIKKVILLYNIIESENSELSQMGTEPYIEYFNYLIFNEIVLKELNKSFLGLEIYKYMKNELDTYLRRFKSEIVEFCKYIYEINIYGTEDIESIQNNIYKFFENVLIFIFNIQMDSYALSRIFKKFNQVKEEANQPDIPRNIIIYTGQSHSKTYRNFLNSIYFDIIQYKDEENKKQYNCVELDISMNEKLIKQFPIETPNVIDDIIWKEDK